MEIQEKKKELISRISNVENTEVLDEIEKILNQGENAKFDFNKAFAEGYTPDKFMEEMKKRISAWPWEK